MSLISMATMIGGCTTVPKLSDATGAAENAVYVGDVVNRVKCEIADAFGPKLDTQVYAWLQDWTVKADLTLEADEQGGISPSATGTGYSNAAVNKATYGTVTQFFSLGATANLGEEATLTETISFTLSVKELNAWRKLDPDRFGQLCSLGNKPELLGHLGLGNWLDAAISPVVNHELLAGKHPAPGAGASPKSPQVASKPKPLAAQGGAHEAFVPPDNKLNDDQQRQVTNAFNQANQAEVAAQNTYLSIEAAVGQATSAYDTAMRTEKTYGPISALATQVQLKRQATQAATTFADMKYAQQCALQQLCGESYGDCSRYGYQPQKPIGVPGKELPSVCGAMSDQLCKLDKDDPQPLKSVDQATGAVGEFVCLRSFADFKRTYGKPEDVVTAATEAASRVAAYEKSLQTLNTFVQGKQISVTTPDPPIDSLGHEVQFVLSYGAGISPSSTLVAFKGPAQTGPLLSGSVSRTQILQLAMGPPTPTTPTSSEQTRIIQNQTILLTRPQ